MYVPGNPKPSWLRMILKVRGSTLPRIWLRCVTVTAVAVAMTVMQESLHLFHVSLTTTPFVLIGLPLGIFLGFRNGASYDRFWEGRRLWGSIVNTSRTLARLSMTLLGPLEGDRPAQHLDDEARRERDRRRRELVHGCIAYAQALRLHLRSQPILEPLRALLPAEEVDRLRGEKNIPAALLLRMGERVSEAWARGWIHPMHVPLFEATLGAFTDCQGGCERIRSTPVPFSYIVLIHRMTGFYCLFLPMGLIDTLHYYTPLAVLFVSYALFGLDAIGDEIEDPFGLEVNDLPLTAISRTIEINLRQALGEDELPPAIEPKDHVLQ